MCKVAQVSFHEASGSAGQHLGGSALEVILVGLACWSGLLVWLVGLA
jgi:hypothetical protein